MSILISLRRFYVMHLQREHAAKNWLEDIHMGYEEGRPVVFDRNINGWVGVPENIALPDKQQDRDMLARATGQIPDVGELSDGCIKGSLREVLSSSILNVST